MLFSAFEAILLIHRGRNIVAPMDDIRITLSDSSKAFVDAQVAEGNYSSASECIDAALRAKAKAEAQEKLEGLLLEGLEGEDIAWTPELMDEIRQEARRSAS
jgi:antitoxin ParD1/3/4